MGGRRGGTHMKSCLGPPLVGSRGTPPGFAPVWLGRWTKEDLKMVGSGKSVGSPKWVERHAGERYTSGVAGYRYVWAVVEGAKSGNRDDGEGDIW